MSYSSHSWDSPAAPPTCARHPDRIAMVRCQRCDAPTCPDCQRPAPVGVQCVGCVRRDPQRAPMRSALGAELRGGKPVATIAIIVACLIVFIVQRLPLQASLSGCLTDVGRQGSVPFDEVFGLIPLCVPSEPWRLVTSGFLHVNLAHIAMNMYALWVVGSFLEQMLGRWRLVALFCCSILGGSLMVDAFARLGAFDPIAMGTTTLGASGGVFGLFGALVLVMRRVGADMRGVLAIIGINVVFSFVIAGISWQGHLGGLATGFALGAIFAFAPAAKQRLYSAAGTAGVGAALVAFAAWLRGQLPY